MVGVSNIAREEEDDSPFVPPEWLTVLIEDLSIGFAMTCDGHRATRREREEAANALYDEILADIPDNLEELLGNH